ncbi:uncharacterized protein LOC135144525 [Zophobas morio]|uniref:uncharacterized protein LOC135144525 n=1 Tax=Zophobas morio TaxID=2755281 RepID=UPI003082A1F7
METPEDFEATRSLRKRRAIKFSKSQPSCSHYVGYVEDGESVSSIMKKFEELEKYKEQLALNNDKHNLQTIENTETHSLPASNEKILTEEQLEEIFKRTSMFSAKSIINNNAVIFDSWLSEDEDLIIEALELPNESDYDNDSDYSEDEDLWDEDYISYRKKRKNRVNKGLLYDKKEKRKLLRTQYLLERSHLLTGGQRAAIKRRERFVDPRRPTYVRLPEIPLPLSWCPTIEPLQDKSLQLPLCTRYYELDLHNNIDRLHELLHPERFVCIYMDPPLSDDLDKSGNTITVAHLERMRLDKLLDTGFIFIWLEKQFVVQIFNLMARWNFRYVENICWLMKTIDNKIHKEPAPYLLKSKLTCYIFRKIDREIELRHQRNCDVVIDFVQPILGGSPRTDYRKCYRPDHYLYATIETLLPDARCACNRQTNTPRVHVGQCLELWSRKKSYRQGWTSVAYIKET